MFDVFLTHFLFETASKLDRQLVWLQYSALLGHREHQLSDRLFTPVINNLVSKETINLLDIEALYLAVLLTLRIRPSLLNPRRIVLVCDDPIKNIQSQQPVQTTQSDHSKDTPTTSTPSQKQSNQIQQKIHPIKDPNIWEKLWQNASDFFTHLRRSNDDENELPQWFFRSSSSSLPLSPSPTPSENERQSPLPPLKQNEIDYFSTLQQLMLVCCQIDSLIVPSLSLFFRSLLFCLCLFFSLLSVVLLI